MTLRSKYYWRIPPISGGGCVGYDGSINSPKHYTDRVATDLEIKIAPTNGDLFIKQMLEYGKSFRESKSTANNSCGLHVHVDARDLNDDDLDKVLLLWSKIESSMFSLVSPSRQNTNWCRPWGFSSNLTEIYNRVGQGRQRRCGACSNCRAYYEDYRDHGPCARYVNTKGKILKSIKDGSVYPERYSALNLLALHDHGTLENRMHHGTTNINNIIPWAMLNASIIDYAKNSSLTHIEELPSGWDTLMMIAPSDKVRDWATKRREAWNKNARKSIRAERKV